jgi:hypothetical protein
MLSDNNLDHLSEANRTLVREWLDFVENDSENLERVIKCMSDDCVWTMEPGGAEYRGVKEIRALVDVAMSGRKHDAEQRRIQLTNWFAEKSNFCYEYSRGAPPVKSVNPPRNGEVVGLGAGTLLPRFRDLSSTSSGPKIRRGGRGDGEIHVPPNVPTPRLRHTFSVGSSLWASR